jgi:hypothetical protein
MAFPEKTRVILDLGIIELIRVKNNIIEITDTMMNDQIASVR